METIDLPRHRIIKSLLAQPTEKAADAAIHAWERLAIQIISIVGEDGFNSLYARSLFLSQTTFPWLSNGSLTLNALHRFDGLKTSLEGQAPAQANEANSQLLITFTSILASLIGEKLTTHLLRLAWDMDTSLSKGAALKNG